MSDDASLWGPLFAFHKENSLRVGFIRMLEHVVLLKLFGIHWELFYELGITENQEGFVPKVSEVSFLIRVLLNHFLNISVTISIEFDVLFLHSLDAREWSNENFEFRIHFFEPSCINIDFDEKHVSYVQDEWASKDERGQQHPKHCWMILLLM